MINLINLPQLNSLDDKLDPPLGLMYIAASLRERNIDVKITDLSFVKQEDWQEAIGSYDTYGITVFSASLYIAKQVVDLARKNNPKCRIIMGGPHPTSLPEDTLNFCDCVVCGEGEYALFHLNGIVTMPQIADLSKLPFPARDLVNIKGYHRIVDGQQATSITTSRGCPYSCAFCYKDVFGSKVRNFPIDYVISEIKSIIHNYDIRAFIIYDDTFALNRKRLYPLCERLAKLNVVFRCNGDARHNTLEDFQRLYDAGCREIEFGIESGSQKILNNIHKDVTVEQNRNAIKNAKSVGLIVKAFLMVGNPGETAETIEETKQFIVDADPDQFTLFTFIPLPGCDIWKNPDKYKIKIIDKNFENYFSIAGNYDAGKVVDTEELTHTQIQSLKENLVEFLKDRGQRGKLQKYYANIK